MKWKINSFPVLKTISTCLCLLSPLGAIAGQPLITFTPLTSTTVRVYTDTSQKVFYTVTNQSSRPHTLTSAALPQGVTQVTSGQGVCKANFSLQGGQSCTLIYTINGGVLSNSFTYRPQVCQVSPNGGPSPYLCYRSSSANAINTNFVPNAVEGRLTISQDFIGLSVLNTTLNAALTGSARTFIITNNGPNTANLVNATFLSSTSNVGIVNGCLNATLAPQTTCTIQITPTATPNTTSTTTPAPTYFLVNGTNTNILYAGYEVLTYGNLYQDANIYSINDGANLTTPNGSIGGAGLNMNTDFPSFNWSNSYDDIPGVTFGSTSPCNASTDGKCNTDIISTYYSTAPQNYAAGYCSAMTAGGYTDWYLPATCELGYGPVSSSTENCGTQSSPTIQNVWSNLRPYFTQLDNNVFWSSTQEASGPSFGAIFVYIGINLGSSGKKSPFIAACARQFTNPA